MRVDMSGLLNLCDHAKNRNPDHRTGYNAQHVFPQYHR
jgi:hypothetical protein